MATVFGSVQEYNQENELFSAYLERVNLFFAANSVADDKRVPIFLTVVGSKTYSLLRNLVTPSLPQDKSFADLVEVLKSHFEPKPLVIAERFHFHKRSQALGESLANYMAELRKLSTHCEFGDHLNEALRDRLVCGLRDTDTQRKLLTTSSLTLAKALDIAQGAEAAQTNLKALKGEETHLHAVGKACHRCGGTAHDQYDCWYREQNCNYCGKQGHKASVCRARKVTAKSKTRPSTNRYRQADETSRPSTNRYRQADETTDRARSSNRATPKDNKYVSTSVVSEEAAETSDSEYLSLNRVGEAATPPIKVSMLINSKPHVFELDTGAAVTIMSQSVFQKSFPELVPEESSLLLKTYSGEQLQVKGEVDVQVRYERQTQVLSLAIVAGSGPSLLGRDWLQNIQLDWREVKAVAHNAVGSLGYLLDKYGDLFDEEVGTIKGFKAKLHVKPDTRPKFFKHRAVPYALRGAVEDELDRLEREGVIEKVTHSEWATPVVAVPKADGRVRLCGDFKITVNPSLEADPYPLPKAEDLFATLAGGKHFTKLDLTQAYLQCELDSESQKYCTINTHRGLYQYKRLPFGISTAPAIFQKTMDTILQGIDGAMCYIDDILVTGATEEEHLRRLEEVLRRLQAHGVRMKKSKCSFCVDSVEYLGHRVDAEGLRTTPEKMRAIDQAPPPKNVQQLRSFLGLLNYYRKFLPNLASIIQPMNDLLQKGRTWVWSSKCAQAMKSAKQLLTTSNLLAHYDATAPLKMAADASQYGLGAVISHVLPDGVERPVAFASRSLSKSERNYSQIDKEALALVYGVKKFHSYLYGRKFTLVTDHQPLTSIFGPKKGVPAVAAARLQRWALLLSAYNCDIEFRPTAAHGNADALSRLPLPEGGVERPSESHLYNIHQLEMLPITSQTIKKATQRDPILCKVLSYMLKGWPVGVPNVLRPYHSRLAELSVEDGCVLWGGRVIIPKALQESVLSDLHKEHMGIAKMKALARGHVWWSGLDKDLEALARSCRACLAVKQAPANAPLHPWVWPSQPWQRIHVDFAGPFMEKSFFIVVDAHSKWAEVMEMPQTTTAKTIGALRRLFAIHGIPEQIVSDNGPQFIAADFEEFTRTNGIKHSRSSPYHPASNGEAERFVRTFKEAMKAGKDDGLTLAHRLQNFLLTYRTTPHSTTGTPPCELLMGRHLRTRWDLLQPDLGRHVRTKQWKQKEQHDQHVRMRVFPVGQSVMARNFRPGAAWLPGVIAQQLGPLTYLVDVSNGRLWKRHVDHLKDLHILPSENETGPEPRVDGGHADIETVPDLPLPVVEPAGTSTLVPVPASPPNEVPASPVPEPRGSLTGASSSGAIAPSTQPTTCPSRKQYPRRSHERPDRFRDHVW